MAVNGECWLAVPAFDLPFGQHFFSSDENSNLSEGRLQDLPEVGQGNFETNGVEQDGQGFSSQDDEDELFYRDPGNAGQVA